MYRDKFKTMFIATFLVWNWLSVTSLDSCFVPYFILNNAIPQNGEVYEDSYGCIWIDETFVTKFVCNVAHEFSCLPGTSRTLFFFRKIHKNSQFGSLVCNVKKRSCLFFQLENKSTTLTTAYHLKRSRYSLQHKVWCTLSLLRKISIRNLSVSVPSDFQIKFFFMETQLIWFLVVLLFFDTVAK